MEYPMPVILAVVLQSIVYAQVPRESGGNSKLHTRAKKLQVAKNERGARW